MWGITDKRGFVVGSMNGELAVQLTEVAGEKVQLSKWFVDSYPPGEGFWLPQNMDRTFDEKNTFGFCLRLYSSGNGLLVLPYWFPVFLSTIFTAFPWVKCKFSLRAMLIATTLISVILGLLVT